MKNEMHGLQQEAPVKNGQIIVSFKNTKYILSTKNIVRMEGSGMYTIIHSKSKDQYVCTKNLKVFEEDLESECFFRTHKSHLINLNEVKGFKDGGRGGDIIMSDNFPVEVSCRKKAMFLRKFFELYGRSLI